jgi:hypothetical protein
MIIMIGPVKNNSTAGNSIERKRQRDRERRATMSIEQWNKFNKKHREACQWGQNVMPNVLGGDETHQISINMYVHKPTIGK